MNLLDSLKSGLKDVELPEVKVTLNDDVYRNLFITFIMLGVAFVGMALVYNRLKQK